MRQVEDDQVLRHLRQVDRELPGDHAAPVVSDDRRLVAPEMADHRRDVADEQADVVVLDAFGFVTQVVAALIDRHHLKAIRQRLHLMTPRVPEVRKAVDHHDERALAERRVVNLHSLRFGVAVFDAVIQVGVACHSAPHVSEPQRQRERECSCRFPCRHRVAPQCDEDSTSGVFFTRCDVTRSLGRRGSVVVRHFVTRSSSSAIIAAAALFAVAVPTLLSAQRDTPHLDGRWTLNRALSQIPRDVGFNLEGLSPAGGARPATGGGGGRGRRGSSGGGVTGDPYRAVPKRRRRQPRATVDCRSAKSCGAFDHRRVAGHGHDRRRSRSTANIPARWQGGGPSTGRRAGPRDVNMGSRYLVVVYHVEPNHDLRYSYSEHDHSSP